MSKAVCCKMDRQNKTGIVQVFNITGVILEMPEILMRAYFIQKPIYSYLFLSISSYIMQEHWESKVFCFVDGSICVICSPFLRFV